jgi:hypothetical protein
MQSVGLLRDQKSEMTIMRCDGRDGLNLTDGQKREINPRGPLLCRGPEIMIASVFTSAEAGADWSIVALWDLERFVCLGDDRFSETDD